MTDTLTCDWCGNNGHTADAHPLPADHPHYDPELDDNPLLDLALADFTDWQQRQTSKPAPESPAVVSPIERVLGAGPDVSCSGLVHWWPSADVKTGDPCICGKTTKGAGR